jgi:2-oxoisovalerate dehydrogenase E1 component beta subunit
MNTPGLKMVEPATPYDAKGLLKAAIRDDDPVLYFEHKYLYRRIKEDLPETDYIVPIGKAAVRRVGTDVSIITFGAMVHVALEAAETLAREDDIQVEVLDMRSLLPYDKEAIAQTVQKTNKVIILHEATLTGGIGGEWAAFIAEELFEHLDGPIVRVASIDTPTPYSPPLEDFFLPNAEKVMAAVRRLVEY